MAYVSAKKHTQNIVEIPKLRIPMELAIVVSTYCGSKRLQNGVTCWSLRGWNGEILRNPTRPNPCEP